MGGGTRREEGRRGEERRGENLFPQTRFKLDAVARSSYVVVIRLNFLVYTSHTGIMTVKNCDFDLRICRDSDQLRAG